MTESIYCPFCGSGFWKMYHEDNKKVFTFYQVECLNCGGRGPEKGSELEALNSWEKVSDCVCDREIREGGKF